MDFPSPSETGSVIMNSVTIIIIVVMIKIPHFRTISKIPSRVKYSVNAIPHGILLPYGIPASTVNYIFINELLVSRRVV